MDESVHPSGRTRRGNLHAKKIFELTTASPSDFFTHILPRLVLSNVKVFA